jgi:hypothetical protein
MFGTVIDICKSIIDLISKDKEIKLETRLRVSSILNEISNILQDTAEKLKKDEYPHSNCATMRSLSNNLHFILIDIVNMDILDNLHSLLVEASEIERHFVTRKETNTVSKIEEASGEFKAMSLILKF